MTSADGLVDFLSDCPMLKGILDSYAQNLLSTIAKDYKLNISELSEYYKIAIPNEKEISKGLQEDLLAASQAVIEPVMKHSHLPVRWLVDGCEFCSKFGNVLCDVK